MPDVQPLCVTFRLATPMVIGDYPTHLDDLIAYGVVNAGETPDWSRRDTLPLQRYGAEGASVWCASMLVLDPAGPMNLEAIRRPLELHRIAVARGHSFVGNINTLTAGTGIYKAYDQRLIRQQVSEARGWCLGEREAVVEALTRLRYLGPKRALGAGRIAGIDVEVDPRAESLWRWRHMPEPAVGYAPIEGNLAPPYWDRSQRRIVFAPFGDLEVQPQS